MNQKEKLFFDKLKDIFIGAKIEGDSGFINLMRIKSAYFNVIFKELVKEIEEKIKDFPEFREELFDKLYSFFKTYFSESGSIYFSYTPLKSKIYERVYTNQKDVALFWKTHMLYYVKTDKLWNNLTVDFDVEGIKYKINFDVSKLEHKKANEKREVIYELKEIKDKEITFNVLYSERGKKTKTDEILRTFKKKNIWIDEENLSKIFKIFEKQNEVDFFINKNAEAFLKEQFNLWLKNYLFDDESDFSERRLKQLKVLKEIAYKIIDFVAQFEDELVKIWNKPKFVLNSNYVITLDRIAKKKDGIKVIERIIKHKGFSEQVKEWQELGILKEFDEKKLFDDSKNLNQEYQFLLIDTKYFDDDVKLEILSLFDNLDEELDGWLIHSENYQALKTILPKFQEKVQTIYIDPPYNTGSDEFIYNDKFQHATWLTMMENRLNLARELMREDGVIFVSIGDTIRKNIRITSSYYLGNLINILFNEQNYIATLVRKSGIAPRQDVKHISNSHDYVLVYSNNFDIAKINKKPADISRLKYKDEHFQERGYFDLNQLDRGSIKYSESLDYPIIIEKGQIIEIFDREFFKKIPAPERIEIWPGGDPNDKRWIFRWSKEKVKWGIENDMIVFRKINDKWKVYYKEYEKVDNNLNPRERTNPYDTLILNCPNELGTKEIEDLFNERIFEYPKPSNFIIHLIKIGSNVNSLVLDFFTGSGTTAHAVMKLNKEDRGKRKFILVEMADYFDTVIIPRIKKVAYSFNWKDGKPIDTDGIGIFFKYYDLEQYEQTLRKAVYKESHPFMVFSNKTIYQQYVFLKDLKLLEAMELDYKNNKIKIDFNKIYPNIDLAETISNLTGKKIKKIEKDAVILEDNERIDFNNIDFNLIKPLIWW